jgi:hypothetical protein
MKKLDMEISVSKGNMKVGNIGSFSLPPIKSCPNCSFCVQKDKGIKCYALKAYTMYAATRAAYDRNFWVTKRYLSLFEKQIREFLDDYKGPFFRIHVSGDFYSQGYLDAWKRITADYPNIRFLAFTKAFDLNYSKMPANMKIIWSVMPGMKNYPKKGCHAFAGNSAPKDTKLIFCPGNCESCGMCFDAPKGFNVHFPIH